MFSVSAWISAADVPDMINYQGRLLDDTGAPLVGARDAVFGLYDGPAGGTARWEQHTTVYTDSNGLFNVTLGGTTNSLLAAVGNQFSGLYLDMAFKVGSVMESVRPRQQMVSVAFAELAENIANVQFFEVTGDLSVRQASLGSVKVNSAAADKLTTSQLAVPTVQNVTNIAPATGQVIRIQSQAVFHGLTAKGNISLATTYSIDPRNVLGGAYFQAPADLFLSFSGIYKVKGNQVINKICPTRPVDSTGQYCTPTGTAVNEGQKSFVSHKSTYWTMINRGLCVPVPAGWWVGCYAYHTQTGASYNLEDFFTSVELRLIPGL
jgi:hypothetical protein